MELTISDTLTPKLMMEAVMKRDERYRDSFVFGVSTTNVYCRPTCPARRPSPDHIRFFRDPLEARRGGFRACQRCSPDEELNDPIEEACRFIDDNYRSRLTLDTLAKRSGLSPFHFQRRFKRTVGVSPREYMAQARMRNAKRLLRRGASVRRSSYDSGYNTTGSLYASRNGRHHLGMSPGAYKSGGRGIEVSYVILDSSMGRILVAGTKLGICYLGMGKEDSALISMLEAEYPNASISKSRDQNLHGWVKEILSSLEEKMPLDRAKVPLDIRTSAFKARVLSEIRKIPPGSTKSYSEIAREIGKPDSARAVGNVCATNPVALIIPCHRVVKQNGDPGGYRWGTERKQKLLEAEMDVATRSS